MESYEALQAKPTKTDEEKIILESMKIMHESRVISSTSQRDLYNVVCGRVGVEVDADEVEETSEDAPEGDENVTSYSDEVVDIFQAMIDSDEHLTKSGKPELPELNTRLEAAGIVTLTASDRDQLFEELTAS